MSSDATEQLEEEQEPQGYREWRERERKLLEKLEEITIHPTVEQKKILQHILKKNAETSYLQKYGMNAATDVDSFRARLPVSDYTFYKEYADRIYHGDTSPLMCADPVLELLVSSATTGGQPKLFPLIAEDMELRNFAWSLAGVCLNRTLPGLEKGKVMFFYFIRKPVVAPCGLLCNSTITSFTNTSFRKRPFNPSYRLTSPDEVIESFDTESAMYCHLLLGLLQRQEVVRFGAIFAQVIQRAMLALADWHKEICNDIAKGTLSPRVNDEAVRLAVQPLLRQDAGLADFVRNEFSSGKSSDGIIQRMWPNVRVVDTVYTGSMEAYLPAVTNLSGKLPVICSQVYGASEGYFGVNLNPVGPTEGTFYTLIPRCAYFEFIAINRNENILQDPPHKGHDEVLDLGSLEQGQEYELLVTTVSGLYRYRLGDILKVAGFYNATPVFQFVCRMNIVLSVDGSDKTDEKELHIAVSQAAKVLERELGLRLREYSSTADLSSKPGHYVIFWELEPSLTHTWTRAVMEQCCVVVEMFLSFIYQRSRYEKGIAPLEIRLVQERTFDLLLAHAVSQGSNVSQYKTPRGIKNPTLLQILNSRVLGSYFSEEKPPFDLGLVRPIVSGGNLLEKTHNGRSQLERKVGALTMQ